MRRNLIVLAVVAMLMGGFVLAYNTFAPPPLPAIKGYADGAEVRFAHTEVSDPKVAQTLTSMARSPVLVVASLAQAPQSMLANVYVFTNGITGDGPLGFQPDVFDRLPSSEGYSPLRALNLVTWKDEGKARLLTSATDVRAAESASELTIERPGVVVNMPMLRWPGGQR